MNDYFDLGSYSRPITTASPEAQRWFDRGLIWCYGFNHEEAIRCFEKAIEADSECAMAYWGIAYANGPFINKPWEFYGPQELIDSVAICYETIQTAVALSHNGTSAEKALIQALTHRYPLAQVTTSEGLSAWDGAYADAMRTVYADFPDDFDVIALFAEAMMTRTPWKLWDVSQGVPAENADTVEIMAVLEAGLQLIDEKAVEPHVGILHMYIHTMEMSPTPELALKAADGLRDLVPDGGHLLHMPSHIDVLCGNYYDALAVSYKAVAADAKYLAIVGPFSFYNAACCHDYHLLMYAAMFLGDYKAAMTAAQGIIDLLPDEVLRIDQPHLASTLEGYYSMATHIQVRFGKWAEIIAAPLPEDPQLHLVTTAMMHYAKGVAHAATGNVDEAIRSQEQFEIACQTIPDTRRFFNNKAIDVLAVGRAMLKGELAYRQGHYDEAFEQLRHAVYLDDNLFYTEPWAWMHPPRHALGALLLEQNHIAEAEQVYCADLGFDHTLNRPSQHPNNVWSLHGYAECLRRQNKQEALAIIQPSLNLAMARADVEIKASCCCRQTHHCCD
ncbi:MAG: hypothetical protein AAF485_04335 [Chloroflexota bacterium]